MDQSTFVKAVERLKEQYKLDKITVVADRGLNGKGDLQYLTQAGHDFVIGFTLKKSAAEIQKQALDQAGWTVTSVTEDGEVIRMEKVLDHELKVKVALSEEEIEALTPKRGRRPKYKEVVIPTKLHLTWDQARANKDRADRENILKKVTKDLEEPWRLKSNLKRGRNQYLTFDVSTEDLRLDEARISRQEQFDGYYALITNDLGLSTAKTCELYGGLWQIEESFRILKTNLRSRPVFVWTDRRVKGHFMLCFLAL